MRPLAIVTGGSGGIGSELVRIFEEEGFDVLAPDDVDLRTAQGVEQLWSRVGRAPAAVALNAGIAQGGAFTDIDLADDLSVVDLNVRGTVHLAKLAAAAMTKSGGGRMLFTSSIVASMPGPYQATYNASKSFVQ